MRDNGGSMQNMTLRDYFAGKALAGMFSSKSTMDAIERDAEVIRKDLYDYMALEAYIYADAMLEERNEI